MIRHAGDRRWRVARRAADPRVVEDHHSTLVGEGIEEERIPIIHGAAKTLAEHERDRARRTEHAEGESNTSGGDVPRQGGVSLSHWAWLQDRTHGFDLPLSR